MRISDFEWDDRNALHIALNHGVEPEEAEDVFAVAPIFRKTKRGHYAAFGRTLAGRLLVIVFEKKREGVIRIITGWDMDASERRYYVRNRKGEP